MSTPAFPSSLEPREAARVLLRALAEPARPRTIADAAAESGLALRDADRGLHWLVAEHRGHLRVTEAGDLLFLFPQGFGQPWKTREAWQRALTKVSGLAMSVGKFFVRAWVAIVLVVYVAAFLALLLALMFGGKSDERSDSRRGGGLFYVLLRAVGDSFFWIWHPGLNPGEPWTATTSSRAPGVPFYEKVNRLVFGPTEAAADERGRMREVLEHVRAARGRIGLADVMRITGLPRDQADPLMARLMLDYDGDVVVSDEGGITYRFPQLRRTAATTAPAKRDAPAAWDRMPVLAPLTGNTVGANLLVGALNAFNLAMASFALASGLTVANALLLWQIPLAALPPPDGVPLALGLVPLVASLAIFAFPLTRAWRYRARARAVAHERGRLAVLREVLARAPAGKRVDEATLAAAWKAESAVPPDPAVLTRVVVELGGDVDVDASAAADGQVRYRFRDLEAEARALEAEREAAAEDETAVGPVVFASDA